MPARKQKVAVKCSSEAVQSVGPIRRGLADQGRQRWRPPTSQHAGIGDDSSNNNNSGYCLHAVADGLSDVGMVSSVRGMPGIRQFKGGGDGEKGLVDAKANCTVARRTAKRRKVGRKGECEGDRKRRWGFAST